jgi:hypothetical protein
VLARDSLSRRFICSMHPDDYYEHLQNTIELFAWVCQNVALDVDRVSVQTWSGPKRNSIVRIHQITLTLRMPGGPPYGRVAVYLRCQQARAMRALATDAEKLYFVLLNIATLQKQCAFVRTISEWAYRWMPTAPKSASSRRKATEPTRLLSVPCAHTHNETDYNSHLLTCTACCPTGKLHWRRRIAKRAPAAGVLISVELGGSRG